MPKNLTKEQQAEWRKAQVLRVSKWRETNREKSDDYKREWYVKNREVCIQRAASRKVKSSRVLKTIEQKKQYQRDYYAANKSVIISRWLLAKQEYMKDPLFRLKESVRARVSKAIKAKNYRKTTKTFEMLGCDPSVLFSHIESQFSNGMTWENRHLWHVDHKVPLSIAKSEEELIKLCHYTNLQPLWSEENFAKSDKLLPEYVTLHQQLIGTP